MSRWLGVLITVMYCVTFASTALADDTRWTRASLKGLRVFAVGLLVSKSIWDAGLDSTAMQTDVELRLRQSAIPVVPNVASYYGPVLWVQLSGVDACGGNQLAVSADIQVSRMVNWADPGEKPRYGYAETWYDGYIISVGKTHAADLRDTVRDLVDRFLNAYLAANPKPAAK